MQMTELAQDCSGSRGTVDISCVTVVVNDWLSVVSLLQTSTTCNLPKLPLMTICNS